MKIEENIPLLDSILGEYRETIGSQYDPYRNHVYRVLHYCFAFHACAGEDYEKLVITACFHDLGMWPGDNVDYLAPSISLAQEYLAKTEREEWSAEIALMIDFHHHLRTYKDASYPLVEVFRKGDWVDASLGWRRFGLPRKLVKQVSKKFPNLGFHRNLTRLAFKQFFKTPLNPLPMMKW